MTLRQADNVPVREKFIISWNAPAAGAVLLLMRLMPHLN